MPPDPTPRDQGIPRDQEIRARDAVTDVWREESPRLVGGLYRITHDLDLAEDLAADALVAALEQWPWAGVPGNPGAWLIAVAKRRAVDQFRRVERLGRLQEQLGHDLTGEEAGVPEPDVEHIEDDVLRLMLVSCHPVLTPESQVALTLRLLGGLSTREIARSFMVPEATVVRRITRAKSSIADAKVPFEVPGPQERAARLPSVLHVIYLIFTEGYAATAGDDWLRPALCEEAIRLGRLVAQYFPDDPEVLGLLALLQVFRLNRAVAHGMAFGPDAGLGLVDQIAAAGELAQYHLLPSVRGDLLEKLGRRDEARAEFEAAAALARNVRERDLLRRRASGV